MILLPWHIVFINFLDTRLAHSLSRQIINASVDENYKVKNLAIQSSLDFHGSKPVGDVLFSVM